MTVTEAVEVRHPTQLKMIEKLDAFREALDSLPLHADVWWHPGSIYLDRELFVSLFKGQRVKRADNGTLSIVVDGTEFSSIEEAKPKVTEVIL